MGRAQTRKSVGRSIDSLFRCMVVVVGVLKPAVQLYLAFYIVIFIQMVPVPYTWWVIVIPEAFPIVWVIVLSF